MTVAIIYLIFAGITFLGTNGAYRPNVTHILLALGIIGVCYRLNDTRKELMAHRTDGKEGKP